MSLIGQLTAIRMNDDVSVSFGLQQMNLLTGYVYDHDTPSAANQ